MTLEEFVIDSEPFNLDFAGISDMSDVVARFITFAGNVIGDRVSSLSKFPPALVKLQNIVNTILALIPDEIDFAGGLYLEGGLSDNFKIKKNTFISMPFDISLQNHNFPYIKNNTCQFGDFVQSDY